MLGATRPHVVGEVAVLAAAGLLAVAPPVHHMAALPIRSVETNLVDASILNVPINLLNDILSIPANELQAIDHFAASLFYADNWFAVSPANLWGIDPGDPPKIEALIDMLFPFPALSGINGDPYDWSAGLGQQITGYLAAELPVSSGCAEGGCMPFVDGPYGMPTPFPGIPDTVPNIGLTNDAWILSVLMGQTPFPLTANYFQVPNSELLSGYTFGPDNYPGYYDAGATLPYPTGFGFPGTEQVINPVTGLPLTGILGLPNSGTFDASGVFHPAAPTTGPEVPLNLVPWHDTTFKLDLLGPFENYINHLFQDPTGIAAFPTDNPFIQLTAALSVAFDPYAPGVVTPNGMGTVDPLCTGDCLTQPGSPEFFVSLLNQLFPGQPLIEEWLDSGRGTEYPFATDQIPLGAILPPGVELPGVNDLMGALGGDSAAAANLMADWNGLFAGFDPSGLSADFSALLAGFDLSSLWTDMSAAFATLGTTFSADLAALAPDLASILVP